MRDWDRPTQRLRCRSTSLWSMSVWRGFSISLYEFFLLSVISAATCHVGLRCLNALPRHRYLPRHLVSSSMETWVIPQIWLYNRLIYRLTTVRSWNELTTCNIWGLFRQLHRRPALSWVSYGLQKSTDYRKMFRVSTSPKKGWQQPASWTRMLLIGYFKLPFISSISVR